MSNQTYDIIRKRARAVVLAHHAKLTDLGEVLGLPYQRVSEYLRGAHEPKLDIAMKIKAWGDQHWNAAKGKLKTELNRAMQAQGE